VFSSFLKNTNKHGDLYKLVEFRIKFPAIYVNKKTLKKGVIVTLQIQCK